jgi:hypothetical protein
MVGSRNNNGANTRYPLETRRPVYDNNQFQLPEDLVSEVGFNSATFEPFLGARVVWYYHETQDKAVLADNSVDRKSLEARGSARLSEISNEDLESGDVSGARVTIIDDLPDHLHENLTQDRVVLKPIFAGRFSSLNSTCVSVYPEKGFDNGELPNVDQELVHQADEGSGVKGSPDEVGTYQGHQNSV